MKPAVTMRAVQLRDYSGSPASLGVAEVPVPHPGPGEVLVRVFASPVNPSDLSFIRGMYSFRKPLPAVPGFEGCGTVVSSGSGLLPTLLKGRRVACSVSDASARGGMWAEYTVASANRCVPLRKEVEMEQGATMLVNPLTAWAIMHEIRRGRHRAAVITAAAGALGRMVIRLGRRMDVPVIGIVRRPEQMDVLRGMGVDHALDSSHPEFDARLRERCHSLGATIAFDAISGEMSGRVLRAQPQGSRLLIYGALSESAAQLPPPSLIFEAKRVEGLWLSAWMRQRNILSQLSIARRIQGMVGSDLKSEIQARRPLEEAVRGLEEYAANMTAGKVLLMPGLSAWC